MTLKKFKPSPAAGKIAGGRFFYLCKYLRQVYGIGKKI